jgi:2-polyprenyl-6-methoxyphenol hydroxylase-like FAD-dependent oxidoreductase
MARVVITGAGLTGLSTAMLLARDGHDVTVLERDAAQPPSPAEAWAAWERPGVNQFRQLHYLHPRWRHEVECPS